MHKTLDSEGVQNKTVILTFTVKILGGRYPGNHDIQRIFVQLEEQILRRSNPLLNLIYDLKQQGLCFRAKTGIKIKKITFWRFKFFFNLKILFNKDGFGTISHLYFFTSVFIWIKYTFVSIILFHKILVLLGIKWTWAKVIILVYISIYLEADFKISTYCKNNLQLHVYNLYK